MRQGRIDLIWERILLGGQIHGIFSRPLTLGDITIAKYAHYHSPGFYSMIKNVFSMFISFEMYVFTTTY